jgi:hypothetical protein
MLSLIAIITLSFSSLAQENGPRTETLDQTQPVGTMPDMPGMGTAPHSPTNMQPKSLIDSLEQHATSGTDTEPNSTPSEMAMRKVGNWMLMFHGAIFLNDIQQTGPRGSDKFFSTNWFMPMAQRKLGDGT